MTVPTALAGLTPRPRSPLVVETRSYCEYHGDLTTGHCPACDEAYGLNRAALVNAARIEALTAELKALGLQVSEPPKKEEPGPNETVMVESVAERRARLQAELEAL